MLHGTVSRPAQCVKPGDTLRRAQSLTMPCVGVWNINVLLCSLTLCVCARTVIRWYLRCFHVSLFGLFVVCLCIHASCIDCRWKQSNDSVFLSWPSLSLLVNLSFAPVFPLCSFAFASQSSSTLCLPAVSFEVFLLSLLFLLCSHLVWSQWEVPEDRSAQPHCRAWEESGHYRPFTSL